MIVRAAISLLAVEGQSEMLVTHGLSYGTKLKVIAIDTYII